MKSKNLGKIILVIFLFSAIMAKSQNKLYLSANEKTRSVTLAENSATSELKELLKKGSFTVRMNDYGGFEKVGSLPQSLTTSDSRITTNPGDIMLYQGNQMVIFYGTNSWSYTSLGKIDNATATNVKEFLGDGSVEVTVSLTDPAGIDDIKVDAETKDTVYDMNGRVVALRPLAPGVYIVNKKKVIIR